MSRSQLKDTIYQGIHNTCTTHNRMRSNFTRVRVVHENCLLKAYNFLQKQRVFHTKPKKTSHSQFHEQNYTSILPQT